MGRAVVVDTLIVYMLSGERFDSADVSQQADSTDRPDAKTRMGELMERPSIIASTAKPNNALYVFSFRFLILLVSEFNIHPCFKIYYPFLF